jgi:hypothetical protein
MSKLLPIFIISVLVFSGCATGNFQKEYTKQINELQYLYQTGQISREEYDASLDRMQEIVLAYAQQEQARRAAIGQSLQNTANSFYQMGAPKKTETYYYYDSPYAIMPSSRIEKK